MKILILAILIICSSACILFNRNIDIINVEKSIERCLFLDITDKKNKGKIYLHFSSENGSMNEKIFFKFLETAEDTNSLKEISIYPYKRDYIKSKFIKNKLYFTKGGFHYYYEIKNQQDANFLYFRFTDFRGSSLDIENYKPNYFLIFIIAINSTFLFIYIIVIICIRKNCCTKKQKAIIEENYKSSFFDENN